MERIKVFLRSLFSGATHNPEILFPDRQETLSRKRLVTTGMILGLLLGVLIIIIYLTGSDYRLSAWLFNHRSWALLNITWWITQLGESFFIAIATLSVSAILWISSKRWQILSFWLTIVGSTALALLCKNIFMRARPGDAVLIETSGSFPSGHATIAVAFYGFITYLILTQARSKTARWGIIFLSYTGIILIGFSRLYLGVHYLSDVLAGYLVGGLWLLIGILLTERGVTISGKHDTGQTWIYQHKHIISGMIIFITAIFFAGFGLYERSKLTPIVSGFNPPQTTTIQIE